MIAPSVLIANAGQQFNLRRGLIQAMPPAGNVFGLIKSSAYHILANCLAIPLVLVVHVLRPMHQSIEAEWPESRDCEARDLLEFKAT